MPSEHEYKVTIPLYSGPLDLLLQLIEKAELDITKLALAQVTDQYLQHLKNLPVDASPDEVSAFLVIASRLLQIKSETLLPRPPVREQIEEDAGDLLARQLIIYRRFKELAFMLENNEKSNSHTYLRLAAFPKIEGTFELEGLTLDELLTAAIQVFSKDDRQTLASIISPYRVTIREKISLIANFIGRKRSGTFKQLLSDRPHRLDVVVTFLAILELVKRQLILTVQEGLFEDFTFQPSETWERFDEHFELEFGE